jgi:phosphoglycerol transferase
MSESPSTNWRQVVAKWHVRNAAWLALLEFALVAAVATVALRLWRIDFSVPFDYWGDTLWFSVPIKGMIENGWVYEVPRLSAPYSLHAVAFPSMTNLDWALMKVISLFTSDAGTVLNLFWLFSILLTAWSATLALRLLGIRNWLALGLGVVYAFLPYTMMRSVGHISLVYFCVPLLTLLAIYLARGCEHPRATIVCLLGYGAAVAQGFDYVYFSFFAVLLFVFAGCLGFVQKRSWKPVKRAALACGIVIFAASLNLTPSFLSWYTYGKPPCMAYKSPRQGEAYGLKIRKMLAPQADNALPGLRQWGRNDIAVGFNDENENVMARLGPMAALGLLLSLMVSTRLIRHRDAPESEMIESTASLTLWCLLLATVGGFGAIICQFFTDIRCYNRLSVFIAFLALAAIGLWWQMRLRTAATQRTKILLAAAFVVLTAFSLYDQSLDARFLIKRRPADEAAAKLERSFVKQIEAKVPAGSSVFQLPITGFPPDGGIDRMLTFDHARPYLASSHLHWSWPSFSQQHRRWLTKVEGLKGKDLAEALILSNFRLIWIDRFGYTDDGRSTIASLTAVGAKELLPGAHPRYVALDLADVAARLQRRLDADEFARRQAALIESPTSTPR